MRFSLGTGLAFCRRIGLGFLAGLAFDRRVCLRLGARLADFFLVRFALGLFAGLRILARLANVFFQRFQLGARPGLGFFARDLQLGFALQFFRCFLRALRGFGSGLRFRSGAHLGLDSGFGPGFGKRALRLLRLGERLLHGGFRGARNRIGFGLDLFPDLFLATAFCCRACRGFGFCPGFGFDPGG